MSRSLRSRREAGFQHVEILIVVVLVSLALVPALEALTTGIQAAGIHGTLVEDHYHVRGKLEDVLAQPFAELDAEAVALGDPTAPSSYSDAVATPRRRLVRLARYDGDNADTDGLPFTGGDEGLLWVQVELEGTAHVLETLTLQ